MNLTKCEDLTDCGERLCCNCELDISCGKIRLTKRQIEVLKMLSLDGGYIAFVYREKSIFAFGGEKQRKITKKTLGALVRSEYVEAGPGMTFVISKKGRKYLEELKNGN